MIIQHTKPMAALSFIALLLLLSTAFMAADATIEASSSGIFFGGGGLMAPRACLGDVGGVGECIGEEEEGGEEEGMGITEAALRRILSGGATKYISYGALAKNRVPCSRRGESYYNCQRSGRANPYRRGCTVITHCARFLD